MALGPMVPDQPERGLLKTKRRFPVNKTEELVTMLSPANATAPPRRNLEPRPEASSRALSFKVPLQPPFGRTKTYTRPSCAPTSPGDPTAIVSPRIATEPP